jgi:DNA-binding transcriptional ArsR family regulator
MKTAKQLERYLKGIANHRRIEILRFVRKFDGGTLDQIAEGIQGNGKTTSEHTRRLVQAGLLNKNYQGRQVRHTLSPYGKRFLDFINKF